jgi:hypothetical protein
LVGEEGIAMGIDRIGKGGGVAPPIPAPAAPASTERAARSTGVESGKVESGRVDAGRPTGNVDAAKVAPLDRFRKGEIDIHGYLDLKVEEATVHLSGLSVSELDAVRKMLRDQLATDPALADLVQHATGRAPTVPEDD